MEYFTVSQVGNYVSAIFKAEVYLHNIKIFGEVSGYKISQNHAYFTLKDENSAISCTCFNYIKTYVPKDGESVIIKCSPNYYVKGGKLSFNVDYIEPVGKGLLYVQLEQLKQKLETEGLFSPEYKKPIPKFVDNVGVVTSKTGAVIRDICTTIRKYNQHINIILKDTKVQGIGAVEEIIEGIAELDKLNLDAIIIARGGGSFEDLMPFNDERLARAIFSANTPIISAVGHETDFTICDFVADIRCATPTASGELVAYSQQDFTDYVSKILVNCANLLSKKASKLTNDLYQIDEDISSGIKLKFTDSKNRIINLCLSIKDGINKKVLQKTNKYIVINNKNQHFNDKLNNKIKVNLYRNGSIVGDISGLNIGDNVEIKKDNILLSAVITDKKVENE